MADASDESSFAPDADLPPGTFQLIKEDESDIQGHQMIILDPVPTNDPNEPLNWSRVRKAVNFGLVLGLTVVIFTALSIQSIFWQQMTRDLQVSYAQLNHCMSVNFAGLAIGCIVFIPFAKKYGRRPVYIASTGLMLATSFWASRLDSLVELYMCNLLQGLAGATNEAIAEITIADLFFVHHRGRMNGLYMTMVMIGSFLSPMAAGSQATRQGWRWSYQTLGIFDAIFFVLFVCLYEETKYIPIITGQASPGHGTDNICAPAELDRKQTNPKTALPDEPNNVHHELDFSIPPIPWRKRLALATPTPEPILPSYYRPFYVLFSFPAVLFTALQYAAGVVWLTVMSSVLSLIFPLPPYNFSPEQIGFMSAGPFIGHLLGAVYGGFLGDWSILYYSRKNRGFYEPEMRLYILHIPTLATVGGLIMFGVTVSRGMHWIYPSIAGVLFGFGLGSVSDAVLTLVIDSYREITGDAFTAIAFMRNAFSIGIPFAITPWMHHSGLQNMFIICGFVALAINAWIIPMGIWGKDARRVFTTRYYAVVGEHAHGSTS